MSIKERTKNLAKQAIKKKIKRVVMLVIAPFLPYIIFFGALFIFLLLIIDAVYIQFVQSDDDLLSKEELETKQYLTAQVEQYNSNDDFDDNKNVSWSEIYAILTFFNISNGEEITQELIDKVVRDLKSTFKYKEAIIKTENKNDKDEWVVVSEEKVKLLVESITIKGHFKYTYKEVVTETENTRITSQEFVTEELIGERYAMLKNYLKKEFKIKDDDLETQIAIVIEAGKGFYDNRENTNWLIENENFDYGIYVNGNAKWPLPPQYTYISSPYGYRIHPITGAYSFHSGIDIPAPENISVLSVVDGIVTNIFYTSINGNTIVVRDSKYDYLFLHLSKIDVEIGQEVKTGERIRRSSERQEVQLGNHLHFMITEGSYTNGKTINPLNLVSKEAE